MNMFLISAVSFCICCCILFFFSLTDWPREKRQDWYWYPTRTDAFLRRVKNFLKCVGCLIGMIVMGAVFYFNSKQPYNWVPILMGFGGFVAFLGLFLRYVIFLTEKYSFL